LFFPNNSGLSTHQGKVYSCFFPNNSGLSTHQGKVYSFVFSQTTLDFPLTKGKFTVVFSQTTLESLHLCKKMAEQTNEGSNVTVEDMSWVDADIAADQNPRQDANAMVLVDMLDRMMDLEEKRKNIEKQIFENISGARISFSRDAGFSGDKKQFSVEFAKFRDGNLPHILGAYHKRMIIHQDYADLTSRLRISSRKKSDSQIVDNVRQASEVSSANRYMIATFRERYGHAVREGVAPP
jgi:hypothetical protein